MNAHRERELIKRAQAGDRAARGELITAFLRLIAVRARAFRARGCPIPADDLIQEAAIAVLSIVNRFDLSRGFRFSSFALPRIDGAIRDYARRYGFFLSGGYRTGRVEKMQWLGTRRTFEDGRDEETFQLEAAPERIGWLERDALDELLRSCSPRNREVMRLRFGEGLEMKEIGRRVRLSQAGVSVVIAKELARLRAARMEAAA